MNNVRSTPREKDWKPRYVLMTAAHNEEKFIEHTIESVCRQTVTPKRWVVVSDNSSDRTAEIVAGYARKHEFIRLVEIRRHRGRSFAAKARALQNCAEQFADIEFDFIGNLDADMTLPAHYYSYLLDYVEKNSRVGLVSGFICEQRGGKFQSRSSNRIDSVPHAAQLVRRECYEEIGGYSVLPYGGEDWYAQTRARMSGWQAESLPQLPAYHHRATGGGDSAIVHRFRLGKLDYSFGSDPVFEILKCMQRLHEAPAVLGAMARLVGFLCSCLQREERPVPEEFVNYLRSEQKRKVNFLLRHGRPINATAAGKEV